MQFIVVSQEIADNWSNQFDKGIFKCPSKDCDIDFPTWISLLHHVPECKVDKKLGKIIMRQRTLVCEICKKEIEIGAAFSGHFRRYHKDVS